MDLVLWFLKKNLTISGKKGDTAILSAIPYDRIPIGYRGVEVFIKEEALEKGLTDKFIKLLEEEK